MPIFGWSHYSVEGLKVGCSVEWSERTPNVISYNMTIFVAVFLLPVSVLFFTNAKLIYMVSRRFIQAGNVNLFLSN